MKLMILSVSILLNAACATGGPKSRAASYSVPVPEHLKKYSSFDLDEVNIQNAGDQLTIRYVLPRELTGKPQTVEFAGKIPTSGAMVLSGPNGQMKCKSARDLSTCEVAYKDIQFDSKVRTEVLKSVANSNDELVQREAVAVAFYSGGEPHGILHVYNYNADRVKAYQPK